MKTFGPVVAAILLAATVISAGVYAKVRTDQWKGAVAACYAQLDSDRSAFVRADAADPRNGEDDHVIGWSEARARETQIYGRLLRLLENKPFGVALTAEEQSVLDSMKVEVARRDP